ncbi:MAG: protein kinase domain-containing protein [Acidimicrobiales bacterium]
MAEAAGPIGVGTEVGPYRLVQPIGSGAFATVWRARDQRLDAVVAVKILAENRVLDPDVRERFLGEAQLLRRIDSGHVIRILDVGETPGLQPFLVLEYADGGEWGERVEQARSRGVTPTRAELVTLAGSLADGLAAVHAQDIVHRDVSPGNILIKTGTVGASGTVGATGAEGATGDTGGLLAPGERLCLSDLGYAKDLSASSGVTVGGGTPRFSAPEQRRDITRVDPRADIYAASAVVAWTVVSDRLPVDLGPEPVETLRGLGMDPAVAAALAPGLAADPDGRPADAAAWGRGVTAVLGEGPTAPASRPVRAPSDRTTVVAETAPTLVAEPAATLVAGPVGSAPSVPAGTGPHGTHPDGAVTGLAPGPRPPAPRRRRWWLVLPVVVAVVVAAALGAAVGALWATRTDDGVPAVAVLDDGTVRISAERGAVAAAVFLPPEPVVGRPVTVTAGATGVETLVWVLPDGSSVAGVDRVEVTPRGVDDVIRLVAIGPDSSVVISHPVGARER